MCVLAPSTTSMSMCCDVHALMPPPGLCCIVQAPDATSRAACGTVHVPNVVLVTCRNVHAPDATYRARGCSIDVPDVACRAKQHDAASMLMRRNASCL